VGSYRIAMGISRRSPHDDLATVCRPGDLNTEVAGSLSGAGARTTLGPRCRRVGAGGEGGVIRDTTLSTSTQACSGVGSGGGQHDHLARQSTGTAITRFRGRTRTHTADLADP